MLDMKQIKEVADRYGIKVTQGKAGKGGLFYIDENGNKIKMSVDDMFPASEDTSN